MLVVQVASTTRTTQVEKAHVAADGLSSVRSVGGACADLQGVGVAMVVSATERRERLVVVFMLVLVVLFGWVIGLGFCELIVGVFA